MTPMTVEQLNQVVHGVHVCGPLDSVVTGVAIDSRKVSPQDVYIAFPGENVDGHAFVSDAFAKGAAVALVSKDVNVETHDANAILRVDNPLGAIWRLASFEREQFTGPVIGVTGSNGKTTTKEMLAAVFQVNGPCLYTQANFNNELGLPLTILQRNAQHRSMILEMGMRGRGQIQQLCEIAKPTAGIITNIGHSHIELLGSQEQIALAKAELIDALPEQGTLVLWADDVWLKKVSSRFSGRTLWYSLEDRTHADAYASDVRHTPTGTQFTAYIGGSCCEVNLPTFGTHNVLNALSALLMGHAHGLDLKAMADRLRTLKSTSGRLDIRKGNMGRTVIDDCYNASPLSMKSSLDVLVELAQSRPTVAVLGDMFELGPYEREGHRDVGSFLAKRGVEMLIAIGERAHWIAEAATASGQPNVLHFPDKTSAAAALREIPKDAVVLVKASRGMHFEDIVSALCENA